MTILSLYVCSVKYSVSLWVYYSSLLYPPPPLCGNLLMCYLKGKSYDLGYTGLSFALSGGKMLQFLDSVFITKLSYYMHMMFMGEGR